MNRKALSFITSCMLVTASIGDFAYANQIEFTHEGRGGSGTLDGTSFTDVDFVFRAVGDTDNRVSILDGLIFVIPHDVATVELFGIGTFDILVDTSSFVNKLGDIVGFSRSSLDGESRSDLFNGPENAIFDDWDMTTSIGPVAQTDGELLQGRLVPATATSGGILEFDSAINLPTTFTAIVGIPEPGSRTVLFGILALAIARRRGTQPRFSLRP